ncbi:MAG: beta strand repeat-containing protein [Luteolibacter sp.]
MKSKTSLRHGILLVASSLLGISLAPAQTTYTWANSNVTGTPTANLDWFNVGPNTQGTWIGGDPVSDNLNTIQIFENTTTTLPNTANPSTQTINLNNGGNAFELGTLTLSGRGSATTNANLTMNLAGDALNFSAATGTINLDALNNTRTITYNVGNAIELGTASSATALTIQGGGNSTFNITGNISELFAGGGSLIKSGTSTVSLTGTNTFTGGTTINAGTLSFNSANALGASGSRNITFGGNSTLAPTAASTLDTLTVNSGVVGTIATTGLSSGTIAFASTTGSGSIRGNGGQNRTLSLGDASTFTGNVELAYAANNTSGLGTPHIQFSSLADTAGSSIQFYRTGGGSDSGQVGQVGLAGNAGPVTFNNRQIQILPRVATSNPSLAGAALVNNNSIAANTWTINTNLLNESDRNVGFILQGSNVGNNTFAGSIGDSTFSGTFTSGTGITNLQKAGTGTWVISGNNSYTGGTSVSAGTLQFAKTAAMPASGTVAVATGATLAVNAGGTGEFTGATSGAGSIGGLLAGTGGQGAAVTWTGAVTLGIDTTNATGGLLAYAGDIATVGTTLNLRKMGTNTLTLSGNNSFNGTLTVAEGALSIATINNASTNGVLGNSTNAVTLGSAGNTGTLLYTGATASSTKTFAMAASGTGGFNIQEAATDLTLGGIISGSGAMTKTGAGTLILTNTATQSGGLTISQGILQLGNGGTTGALAASNAVNISSGASLVINRTANLNMGGNVITGDGSVVNSGNTLTLSNSNSFSGGFTLNSGGIAAPASGTFNGFGTGTFTYNGGTLNFGSASPTVTYNNNMIWNSVLTLNRATSGTPTLNFDGNITLGANSGYANNSTTVSHNLVFNGNISDGGNGFGLSATGGSVAGNGMTFNGQNTFTGNVTNTTNGFVTIGGSGYLGGGNYAGNISIGSGAFNYNSSAHQILTGTNSTGATTITDGILQFGKTSALYGGTTGSWTAANIRVNAGGTLAFNVGGTGEFTTGNVTTLFTNLANSTSATNGMNAGSNFGFDTTNAAGGSFEISQVIANSGGAAGGARGLTKLGTGTLLLSNANTYTGATLVNVGTLLINGSTSASSTVTVASGATLGGSGTVSGNTTIAGIHSPGNSPGLQTFGADLTYEAGSSVIWELVDNSALLANRGVDYDGINVGGVLNFEGSTMLTLVFSGALNGIAGSDVDWSSSFWNASYTGTGGWLIYSGASELVGFENLGINTENWVDGLGQSYNDFFGGNGFSLYQSGNDVYLNYNYIAIPEPRTALLGAIGFLLLFRRRR